SGLRWDGCSASGQPTSPSPALPPRRRSEGIGDEEEALLPRAAPPGADPALAPELRRQGGQESCRPRIAAPDARLVRTGARPQGRAPQFPQAAARVGGIGFSAAVA